MKITILDINPVPKWKFWKVDNWQVKVEVDYGDVYIVKSFSIFYDRDESKYFLHYVKNKALYGRQFYRPAKQTKFKELIGAVLE